jgi:hypothetical protein
MSFNCILDNVRHLDFTHAYLSSCFSKPVVATSPLYNINVVAVDYKIPI